jgi:hypothetical protein
MGKRPFTTRIDEEVLALARRMAATERRSVTALIEIAVLEYATRRSVTLPPVDDVRVKVAGHRDIAAPEEQRTSYLAGRSGAGQS